MAISGDSGRKVEGRGAARTTSRNCTFERNECDGRGGHGALARYHSTVVTGERRQVSVTRKTSVHALTTSYVLTYDVRGSPGEQVHNRSRGREGAEDLGRGIRLNGTAR